MPRFFVSNAQIAGSTVTITGEDAHHISRSLRMAVGEHITVADSTAVTYDCVLREFLPDAVRAEIVAAHITTTEPPCPITLFQALPKGDKLDTVIQKAVECGVSRIVPFESERCIVRVKAEAEEKKQARRNRIAAEAAKQCGRGILPTVEASVDFDTMLQMAAAVDLVLFCFEGEGTTPISRVLRERKLQSGKGIALIVGSEGGFSLKEAEKAIAAGFIPVGLGPRILRTETAPIFALGCIAAEVELL
ncbi:MAG: 16S rRNA (uracil(1498)-N(3))-methyltransferase [Clostridia bacterium]|nr:16S rRNA (uracil(1498)-N(3))-methyltransferase [Clostridia bacterium]